jgi:hypothetical protein
MIILFWHNCLHICRKYNQPLSIVFVSWHLLRLICAMQIQWYSDLWHSLIGWMWTRHVTKQYNALTVADFLLGILCNLEEGSDIFLQHTAYCYQTTRHHASENSSLHKQDTGPLCHSVCFCADKFPHNWFLHMSDHWHTCAYDVMSVCVFIHPKWLLSIKLSNNVTKDYIVAMIIALWP